MVFGTLHNTMDVSIMKHGNIGKNIYHASSDLKLRVRKNADWMQRL